MTISNEAQLRDIYSSPKGRAKDKVLTKLEAHSINFINHASFVVIATVNATGKMDASPRGGKAGFVKIEGKQKLLIPDYKGNNRIDSLINIVETGYIGLLFMIPGIDETLRINGSAVISTSEKILSKFQEEPKAPISSLVISIEEIFLHCAKAFMRSELWNVNTQINPHNFPTMGKMLNDQLQLLDKTETREDMQKRYQKDL